MIQDSWNLKTISTLFRLTRKYVGKFEKMILCCCGLLDTKIYSLASQFSLSKEKKSRKNIDFQWYFGWKEINERLKRLHFGKGDFISESFITLFVSSKECARSLFLTVNLDLFFLENDQSKNSLRLGHL